MGVKVGLTLSEEHRLMVLRRVLRRVFGPSRREVRGCRRKLYKEELNSLYWSPDTVCTVNSRSMRWAGHVAHMGEMRHMYKVSVGKPEGKRPLRRPRPRWGDNIKVDVREIGLGSVDWIRLGQDRDRWRAVVNTTMNLRVP
jgi:hypothetical protein